MFFWLFFYRFVYDCMFCILLSNSISYVFLLLRLCILIDMNALFCIFFANWHSSTTLTEVFSCSFLICNANARVYLAKTGHGPHSFQLVNLFSISFLCRLCCSVYCLCVNVYCTTATVCLPNCNYQIYYIISYHLSVAFLWYTPVTLGLTMCVWVWAATWHMYVICFCSSLTRSFKSLVRMWFIGFALRLKVVGLKLPSQSGKLKGKWVGCKLFKKCNEVKWNEV
jgi:hypothetical protein